MMSQANNHTADPMLSVAIIARDEAGHIGGCLESVGSLADEVVVLLDSRSCDQTGAISRRYGARVSLEPWRGFSAQRNRALALCRGTWVLFVDADERVTPELYQEVFRVTRTDVSDRAGFWIPRYNIFFGQRLRGGGWYPDYQLRLLRRRCAAYDERRLVHELVQVDGETAQMTGHLLHYNIEQLGEFWQKQTLYALAEARTLYGAGQRVRFRTFLGAPLREFQRRFFGLGGWRDGALGLFLCASMAWFEVVRCAFLRLLQVHARSEV